MQGEDLFDTVHVRGAAQAEQFLEALVAGGRIPEAEALKAGDIAYLFVEYLANTYPKLPREATERDAWVFLFDYCITQGPFEGPALEGAPKALGLFVEWLARHDRVRELEYLRAACGEEAYFAERLAAFRKIVKSQSPAEELEDWWTTLDERMRARGLAPDAALAGGTEGWSMEMGPLEAAVFDAVCLLLASRARELGARRIKGEALRKELLGAQAQFMNARNRGLGDTPLSAIVKERAQLGNR
jgi:hypothetical protein